MILKVKNNNLGNMFDESFAKYSSTIAISFNGWKITYHQLNNYIDRAAFYFNKLGIKKGDCVCLSSRNRPEFIIVEFALYKLGVIVFKLSHRLTYDDFLGMVSVCHPKLLVLDKSFCQMEKIRNSEYPSIILEKSTDEKTSFIKNISKCPKYETSVAIEGNEVACRLHTSGTEGKPKIIELSHKEIIKKMIILSKFDDFEYGNRVLSIYQLFHSSSFSIYTALLSGATLYLFDRFRMDVFLKTINEEKIDVLCIIPNILTQILNYDLNKNNNLTSIKKIRCGGAPLSPQLIKKANIYFDAKYLNLYGMTEMTGLSTRIVFDGKEEKDAIINSVGRPIEGTSILIVDDSYNVLENNKIGQILIKGPGLMNGYLDDKNLICSKFINGYYITGDMGYIDREGLLFLTGRKDDLIISGGENIYPNEIINMLLTIPEVKDAIAYGIKDDEWGEKVKACIILGDNNKLTAEELLERCKKIIPNYKCPKEIVIMDKFPKNASGKTDIQKIKEINKDVD